MNNISTLVSLSMLKIQIDEGRDYFDYLIPFVKYSLAKSNPSQTEAEEIKKMVKSEFGLDIPGKVCELVLGRIAKEEGLTKSYGVYTITHAIDFPSKFDMKRVDAQRNINAVVAMLVKFASEKFGQIWNEDKAVTSLGGYLSQFQIECLSYYAKGTSLPDFFGKNDADIFIVNSFVKEISQYNTTVFESFVILLKGHMLSNALICPDLEAIQKKFYKTEFYFDTPLIMHLLGLSGEYKKESTLEMLELLKRLNGEVCIFRHIADEVRAVIKGYERALETGSAYGPYIINMQRCGITRSDLMLMRESIEVFLAKMGIKEKETPKYDKGSREFEIDQTALSATIDDNIGYVNPRALDNDVRSIRSIYVLRKKDLPWRLEDAKAILVTSNSSLARAAFEYGKEYEESKGVSTVITDFSLTNIAWLKAPLGAPNLPRVELMSMCYAGLEPRPVLWVKYLDEIDRLKKKGGLPQSQYEYLKISSIASEKLMQLTLGREEYFSPKTIEEIKQVVLQELTKEKDVEIGIKDAEIGIKDALLKETQNEVKNLYQKHENDLAVVDQITKKLYWFSDKVGHFAGRGLFIVVSLTLFLSAILDLGGHFIKDFDLLSMIKPALLVIISIGIFISLFTNIFGFSVKDYAEKIKKWVAARVFSFLVNNFGLKKE